MQGPNRQEYIKIHAKHKAHSTKNQCIYKTHKDNYPIRPVIDNTQAPSYKIAKFLNRRIKECKFA